MGVVTRCVSQLSLFQPSGQKLLEVDSADYSWVEPLKKALEESQGAPDSHRLWLLARKPCSGVVGMVNCLRQENGGHRLRSGPNG